MAVSTIRVLLLALAVGFTSATGYHEDIGIPTATRIREHESIHAVSARITDGKLAQLGEYPHFGGLLITLASDQQSVCGSTLISNSKLVTAAHCWNDGVNQAIKFKVILGSITLFSGGQRITTKQVTTHEGYNPSTVLNDIAIITVSGVKTSDSVKPIKYADGSKRYVNIVGKVVGFGKINDSTDIASNQHLRSAEVQVRADNYCSMYGSIFQRSMICGESSDGGPCGGDSGGPLFFTPSGSEELLIGIVSYGSESGCSAGHPVAYTRITAFSDWIKKNS